MDAPAASTDVHECPRCGQMRAPPPTYPDPPRKRFFCAVCVEEMRKDGWAA